MLIFSQCLILIVFYSCFLFLSPDYAVPFLVTGEVTFAIALLLIDIIEDCNLHVKTSLPVAFFFFCELARICLKLLLLEASRELAWIVSKNMVKNYMKEWMKEWICSTLLQKMRWDLFVQKWGLTRSGYAIITNMILNLVWLSQMVPSLNYTST